MNGQPAFTASDLRRCAQRELELRKRVYPKWVDQGRMSSAEADKQIAMMQAIMEDYREQELKEQLL